MLGEAGEKDPHPVERSARDADDTRAHPPHPEAGAQGCKAEGEARQEKRCVDAGDTRAVEARERFPKDAPGVIRTEPDLHDHRGSGDDPPVQSARPCRSAGAFLGSAGYCRSGSSSDLRTLRSETSRFSTFARSRGCAVIIQIETLSLPG